MPLWFFPALLGLFAIISLGAGLWQLLHMRDVVRMVSGRHDGELVPGPGRRRAPPSAVWLALAIFMFSLAGIPPTVGFYAKLAVLQALVASGQTLYIAMAVFAVIMSLIGAFYYLRVVKVMYFDAPLTASNVSAPADVRVVLTLNGALLLVLGLLPGGLMALCADAVVRALAT